MILVPSGATSRAAQTPSRWASWANVIAAILLGHRSLPGLRWCPASGRVDGLAGPPGPPRGSLAVTRRPTTNGSSAQFVGCYVPVDAWRTRRPHPPYPHRPAAQVSRTSLSSDRPGAGYPTPPPRAGRRRARQRDAVDRAAHARQVWLCRGTGGESRAVFAEPRIQAQQEEGGRVAPAQRRRGSGGFRPSIRTRRARRCGRRRRHCSPRLKAAVSPGRAEGRGDRPRNCRPDHRPGELRGQAGPAPARPRTAGRRRRGWTGRAAAGP